MKRAFTMIELILTIVILAIATMAIPNMVAQTAELNNFALKQELVSNAKAVMSLVLKSPWDSASDNILTTTNYASRPATNRGGIGFVDPNSPSVNFGKKEEADKKPIYEFDESGNITSVVAKDKDGNDLYYYEYNDIDDYHGAKFKISVDLGTNGNTKGNYIIDSEIDVEVCYVSDADTDLVLGDSDTCVADPTNIKMVTVTANDINDEANKVVLRYYAFNIGLNKLATPENPKPATPGTGGGA